MDVSWNKLHKLSLSHLLKFSAIPFWEDKKEFTAENPILNHLTSINVMWFAITIILKNIKIIQSVI